jgi:hypothetical protein
MATNANNLAPMMYDGSTNPNTFVEHFLLQALFQGWDDTAKVAALPIFLKGQAKDNYNTIRQTLNDIGPILKALVTMCAQPAEVLLDAFFERKHQPGETISTFAKALKELLAQAEPTLPEANHKTLLLRQLAKSLPPHMQTQINFNSGMPWNELLANLDKQNVQQLKWESQAQHETPNNLIKTEPLDINWATTNYANNRSPYSNCNQPRSNNIDTNYGNQSRSINNAFTGRNIDPTRFNGTCNYCNKFGHKEVDCRSKRRDEQQQSSLQGEQREQCNRPLNRSQTRQPRQTQQNFNNYNPNNRYNNQQYQTRSNTDGSFGNQSNTNTLSADSNHAEVLNQSPQTQQYPYFTANIDTVESGHRNSTPLLKQRVQLSLFNQDPQVVLALIDGGSSHSFISPNVLTAAQLKIAGSSNSGLFRRENFQINGATGTSHSSCCLTTAKIDLGQWSGAHEFVISGSVTRHDMIIGRDFFKAHNVVVDHANDSMVVDSIVISLNVIHSIATTFLNEENEFIDTNEPYEPINKQLLSLQQQVDTLKTQQQAEVSTEIKIIANTTAPETVSIDTNSLEVDEHLILQSGL